MKLSSTAFWTNPAARPARVLGAVTVAYSLAIVVAPKVLAGPCRFTDATGQVPRRVAVLIRALGARDAVSGVAMLVATPGRPLAAAALARAMADGADAILFGAALPAGPRWKIGGFALCWSAANLLAARRTASGTR